MVMKSIDWLQFPRKVNKPTLYRFTHYIHDGVYSDWLALPCAASSPAILFQVQENLQQYPANIGELHLPRYVFTIAETS
jgi:hypothetical protein